MTQFLYISGEGDTGLLDRSQEVCEDFSAASGCTPLRSISTAGGTLFVNRPCSKPLEHSSDATVKKVHVFGECYPDDSATDDSGTLPERLRTIFEQTGPSRLAGFNGRYAMIFEDGRTVFLASDVGGFWPTYWAVAEGRLFVGSNPLLVKEALGGSPLDPVGVAQSLRFGHQLGEHTLWSRVRTCPPGSVMQWDGTTFRSLSQSRLPFSSAGLSFTLERAAEVFAELLSRSVSLRASGKRVSVPLSCGLDSRAMAALAAGEASACSAFTHDWNGCINPVWARRVAGRVGIPHRVVRIETPDVAMSAEATWALLGGTCDLHAAYFHATIRRVETTATHQFPGFIGDPLTGSHLKLCFENGLPIPEEEILTRWCAGASESYLSDSAARRVAEVLGVAPIEEPAREAYSETTAPYIEVFDKAVAWDFLGRQRRYISFMSRLLEERWDVATPFTDLRLLRLCLGWPVALRWQQAAYRLFHARFLPGLAHFPGTLDPQWGPVAQLRSAMERYNGRIRNRLCRHRDKPQWGRAAAMIRERPGARACAKLIAECEKSFDSTTRDLDFRLLALLPVLMSATLSVKDAAALGCCAVND